ncbi:MAG: secreted protein containing glycoside hydrolase family 2, barrel domain [Fibrobacteres bacterium]|nr:secreted protein containing glycoside hydrolase family 2, barrel domain [Fibrobacterota bacterium]
MTRTKMLSKYALGACLLLSIAGCAGKKGREGTASSAGGKTTFPIRYPGSEFLIDYEKYGEFRGAGTTEFQYVIKDHPGLIKASGEGVYPNIDWVKRDPLWEKADVKPAHLSHWKEEKDPARKFFMWTQAWEEWGVRQFFTAVTLNENGHTLQALKAFHATIVHFPKSASYSQDGKYVWYVAPAARQQIEIILAKNPALGLRFDGFDFDVQNGDDTDLRNDIIKVSPGKFTGEWVAKQNPEGYPAEDYIVETRDPETRKIPLTLEAPGEGIFIDYGKYGVFEGLGTAGYKYVIKDSAGLAKAVGEGIWPNTTGVRQNPLWNIMEESGWMKNSHWENVDFKAPTPMYFSWATAGEDPGRKLFYTAEALKYAGMIQNDMTLIAHAIKAYHAIMIHFPGTVMYAPEKAYLWYVANAAQSKILYLLEKYPALKAEYKDAFVFVENEYDIKPENDRVICNPGRFVKVVPKKEEKAAKGKKGKAAKAEAPEARPAQVAQRGKGEVQLRKFANGHWQMFVKDEPFTIQAVLYEPTTIGDSPHDFTLRNWQQVDVNKNGKADGPYDTWIDKNRNDRQDADEPAVGDFQMMKEMGVNAIRFYHMPKNKIEYDKEGMNKELLRDMYKSYGIRAIIGDLLGAYTVGSGADYAVGTDYRDPQQCANMKNIIRDLVMDNKDEPYVLMWLLGNENNMNNQYGGVNATKTLAGVYPEAYGRFLNDVAKMIHEIDPNHPVGIANLESQLIETYEKWAPEIDVLGINSYRGPEGFGNLFNYAHLRFDRPVVITEYGSDVLSVGKDAVKEDEKSQAEYHRNAWENIVYNSAFNGGAGNAIGGMIFEWVDEWWKSNKGPKEIHQYTKDSPMPFQDGWSSEEWLGLNGQGLGRHSPFLRQPREVCSYYKKAWNRSDAKEAKALASGRKKK